LIILLYILYFAAPGSYCSRSRKLE